MREELKTRLSSAGGALATAVVLGALQTGKLGEGRFALQAGGALVGLSWVPYLYRVNAVQYIPAFISLPLSLGWFATCFAPSFYALGQNLLFGHRRPGAHWLSGVWRVYAIVGLWIMFAVLMERVIKPFWKKNSHKFVGEPRSNSIGVQAKKLTLDKRAVALEAIKRRVAIALKRKKAAEKGIEDKEEEIERAQENIVKADKMLVKAKERAEKSDNPDDAKEEVEAMMGMVENARSYKKGLYAEIVRFKLDIEEASSQLEVLQHEWTEALHIENYTTFYR